MSASLNMEYTNINRAMRDIVNEITDNGKRGQTIAEALQHPSLMHNEQALDLQIDRLNKFLLNLHETPDKTHYQFNLDWFSPASIKWLQSQGFKITQCHNGKGSQFYSVTHGTEY